MRNLQERQDLVILTADKRNATVVMDQADYKKKMLEDPVYWKISKDPTSATEMRASPFRNAGNRSWTMLR